MSQLVIISLRCYISVCIQLFISCICLGQIDTSLHLIEINIVDTINQVSELSISPNSNTAHGSLNISTALSQQANIYVKNYGAASSSTLSIRGGSASQALITWDGLPINNPMLGVSDLSLIPSQLFGRVDIIKSGSSAALGNGAITGVIDLSNAAYYENEKPQVDVNLGIGSHGLRQAGLGTAINSGRFQFITKLYVADSDNDFIYKLDSGQERQNTHAHFNTKAWLQTVSYRINSNQKISLHAWLQDTHRELPPTTTQNMSEAVQDDQLKR
ncbi:TonB-dependent receptor, partial [Saprospiraceae bacterium]|nr:TonB-dependent receptor [Saprospiraceae bacterium]